MDKLGARENWVFCSEILIICGFCLGHEPSFGLPFSWTHSGAR